MMLMRFSGQPRVGEVSGQGQGASQGGSHRGYGVDGFGILIVGLTRPEQKLPISNQIFTNDLNSVTRQIDQIIKRLAHVFSKPEPEGFSKPPERISQRGDYLVTLIQVCEARRIALLRDEKPTWRDASRRPRCRGKSACDARGIKLWQARDLYKQRSPMAAGCWVLPCAARCYPT